MRFSYRNIFFSETRAEKIIKASAVKPEMLARHRDGEEEICFFAEKVDELPTAIRNELIRR